MGTACAKDTCRSCPSARDWSYKTDVSLHLCSGPGTTDFFREGTAVVAAISANARDNNCQGFERWHRLPATERRFKAHVEGSNSNQQESSSGSGATRSWRIYWVRGTRVLV